MTTCGWTVDTGCCTDWGSYTAEVQQRATQYATALLDRLTGYQFGQCPVSVRPCSIRCAGAGGYQTWPVGGPGPSSPWMIPYVDNGVWRNCACSAACSCSARCEITMGVPVAEIQEITVDGAVVDPAAYRLDSVPGRGTVLVRTDGDCWPECQDFEAAEGEAGSFVVTYVPGRSLPVEAPLMAGMIACQFAKACVGGDCVLPQEIQSLTRNGVDVQLVDPSAIPEAILTGVADVDRWVRSVNPGNLRSRPRVLSSDLRGMRVTQ